MDMNKHTNRKHKTTDISPSLCKVQLISPEVWAYLNKREKAKLNSQRAQNSQKDSDIQLIVNKRIIKTF